MLSTLNIEFQFSHKDEKFTIITSCTPKSCETKGVSCGD